MIHPHPLQAYVGLRFSLDEPAIRYGLLALFVLLALLIAVRCTLSAVRKRQSGRASTASAVSEEAAPAAQEEAPPQASADTAVTEVLSDAAEGSTADKAPPTREKRYACAPPLSADTSATLVLVPTDCECFGDTLYIYTDIYIDAFGG